MISNRKTRTVKTIVKILSSTSLLSPLSAALILPDSGSAPGTDGYTWNFGLNAGDHDTSEFVGTVGSWSWEDARIDSDSTGNIGWRHQSDWIALTLTADTRLTVNVARFDQVADAKFFPSFTIYQNLTNTNNVHTFENDETLSWDPTLIYQNHADNSSYAEVTRSFELPAGDYTIALGGNALSEANAVNVNYRAQLTSAPGTIPEPSSSLLALLAGLGFLARRAR